MATSRYELAQYLVDLHTLMEAQESTGLIKSSFLADEYIKHWGLLRTEIEKENDNESKDIRNSGNVNESRADPSRDQPWRGIGDRKHGGNEPDPTR